MVLGSTLPLIDAVLTKTAEWGIRRSEYEDDVVNISTFESVLEDGWGFCWNLWNNRLVIEGSILTSQYMG